MSDTMSKALLCGLGLASLTKDTIEKTVEELIKQSKITEEEGKRVLKELPRRSKRRKRLWRRRWTQRYTRCSSIWTCLRLSPAGSKMPSPRHGKRRKLGDALPRRRSVSR